MDEAGSRQYRMGKDLLLERDNQRSDRFSYSYCQYRMAANKEKRSTNLIALRKKGN
jgi:hypothetical protein